MKTLKELFEIYRPKAKGEQDFVNKHVVIKHKDRNGNGDDVFNGKTKVVNRKKERHGYDVGDDEKVYEEAEELDELSKDTLKSYVKKSVSDLPKRGIAAQSKFDKGESDDALKHLHKIIKRQRSVDTALDKMTKEEVEDLDELSKSKVGNYMKKAEPVYDKAHSEVVNDTGGNFDKSLGTLLKRAAGHQNAKAKLSGKAKVPATNEEVEDLDESNSFKHDDTVQIKSGKWKGHIGFIRKSTKPDHYEIVDGEEYPRYGIHHIDNLKRAKNPNIDEAVSVSHDRYLRSHGKKASGSGAWIFTHKKNGNIDLNDDKVSHIGKGKFSDAAKSAKAWAKKHGHTTVYVAEEHADEMLRNSILEMAELEGEDLTEENLDTLVEALLDELSKGTLSSYVIKATHPSRENSISNLASKGGFKNASTSAGSDDDKDPNKNGEKEDSKAAKRSYGVIRAVSKLTKEDVINRAIEKYVVSEAELPTPADRLLSKLDGLSETHVNTLLTIFDSLNEDNQIKMLYTAESHEGILSLLDFAIQNKGA